MSSRTHHHGTNINNINSERGMCLPTQSRKQLGEGLPAPKAIVDTPRSSSRLVDHAEENICNWMDSGFFLSASPDLQGSRDKAALSPPLGMVQMTVQNYMHVTEWLDFSKKDPVEILLDLGFGMDEPDICTKIPSRFISSASMAKGINIRVFIEAQKHRMDLESPNLCGRFLQLEVLDHVTSAFSSLLNDINLMQKNTEDRNGEGRGVAGTPKGKVVVSQAKRRRIGQLLRKVSRQTTTCGPPAYRTADSSGKTSEDGCSFVDVDKCISARSALCEHTTLDSLKEEMFPSDEEEKTMTLSHPPSKIRLLPHLSSKQTHFLSTSEMPIKDRPRKEPSLLLNYMLKRVSGLNGKPSDSFEMEEIQSFEDESSWGNPLESTSDTIVTRTNSCQSDSSGFLEDPSDPLPLQVLSLPGNKRLSCNAHDNPAYLRHRKESPQTSQDSHSQAEISVAVTSTINGGNNLLLPTLSREQTFQGEEVFCSINEEDDLMETSSGQYEDATSEMEDESRETEMQDQRGQLRKEEDRCIEGHISCHQINNMDQDNASSPEGDWPSYASEMYEKPGSAANEVGCTTTKISNDQLCTDLKNNEGLLTEEETGKVCRENEQEGTGESVEGKRRDSKLEFPCPATDMNVTNDYQEAVKLATGFGNTCRHLDLAPVSGTEQGNLPAHRMINTISMIPLQDSTFSTYRLENGGINSLNGLSASTKLDKDKSVPALETNRSPFRSVTVQMPSMLFSSTQSIHSDDAAVKGPSLDFTSKASQHSDDEPLIFSVSGAFKEEDKEVKDVCIQTERSHTKRKAFPLLPFPPLFHGHSHLVKSASLDTGLHGECRSGCYEPFHAWCAQHSSHCYALSSHPCCLLQSLPLAPLCKHHATCYSSHATLELQLLKTLRLLQDTAMRNVSSCTVHEIEDMKNSCQKFRQRLDEIELHLTEQEIHLSSTISDKGREERRHLQSLRQAVRREVAELECQLKDRARQQLDQLLDEQSNLCSELGISGARSEHSLPEVDAAATSPFLHRAGCSKDVYHRPPRRSSTVPPSPSISLLRKPEASPLPQGKTDSTTDSKELHGSKKETKGLPQAKLDFKAFIQNLKKSFRNSFSNDATEGKD